jgi:hypothetical protein
MKSLQLNQYTPFSKNLACSELSCLVVTDYVLRPFDNRTLDFLDALSKSILLDRAFNRRPEIAALGFWLRKAQLKRMLFEQDHLLNGSQYKVAPLGKVFHICPANVDTMFIYSMVVALLMGNRNILRISKRMDAPRVLGLFEKLNTLMEMQDFKLFQDYINIVSYDHNEDISDYLSSASNARLIWGGDATIRTFQSFKKSARTKDIVFSDRISMMVLDSESILLCDGKSWDELLRNFYNDAYTFDQMGCSSPQTIYFLGSKKDCAEARNKISKGMEGILLSEYESDVNSLASLKLNRMVDDALEGNILTHSGNNLFKLLELSENGDSSSLHGCGGGYFYYQDCNEIGGIEALKVPKVQTISYFGLSAESKKQLFELAYGEGIDRIVKVGNALNFHYIWDGYNLFQELSRKVYIED